MNTRTIAISTLSPLHIGCDEVYEPSNFVIHDGLLHAFDPADLVAELGESELRHLAALADGREPIGALQGFFRTHAARFAGLARHQVAVSADIARKYERSAGRVVQRGAAGEAVYNLFPIARTAYRAADDATYIPGSSLKGSIRTAWLNRLNKGAPLTAGENGRGGASRLQERLLGYSAGKFENDPFRHLALADAHPEDDTIAPPTRVLYAVSKKKRPPRAGEKGPSELKVFLETVPEALPAAFAGEFRIADREESKIGWDASCDACNAFYKPQLEAELNHPVLGALIDADWKSLIVGLLDDELGGLIAARQGFLLRVGRHSGAESVTLDGVRSIKILGPRVDGRQQSDYRPNTTEKRFASLTESGAGGLLPFGWIWVDACDAAHRHLSDSMQGKLASRSAPLREAHETRLLGHEAVQKQREAARAEAEANRRAAEDAALAEAKARAARAAAFAALSPNLRRVGEFIAAFTARFEQLRGNRESLNGDYHGRARKLAQEALEGADWTAEEKRAVADAVEEWLPKVVEKIDKDQLKKLKLTALRGA